MMRAVIYARYYSDNQREASIEDQVRLCRERAAAGGDHVVEVYSDYALSGRSMRSCSGIKTSCPTQNVATSTW